MNAGTRARRGPAFLLLTALGAARNGWVEILAGVSAGERVALDPVAAAIHLKESGRGGRP